MLDGCVSRCKADAARYRQAGYWAGESIGVAMRRWSAAQQGRTALVGAGRRYSYAELDAWADRLATGLRERGIARGDRIVVQLPNIPEFVALCLALFRSGVIPVFALPAHRAHEIRHLCEISGAVGYVIPDLHLGFDHRALAAEIQRSVPAVEHIFVVGEPGAFTALGEIEAAVGGTPEKSAAPDEADPGDVAFFLLSGGTTALPKLIPRTHDDYLYQVRTTAQVCALDQDTVYLAVLPVEFNFTWGCPGVLGTLHAGGTVVLATDPSPETCFPLIARERVTLTSVVPTIAHLWMEAAPDTREDLSSLRTLQIGSAKLHREVAEQVGPTLGCDLQQVFGMAEGLLTMTRHDDPAETVLTTQGRPVSPADEIRVADPVTGALVPDGAVGELVTRGPYTLNGYYRAPEHNAQVFTDDGFFRTGDLVRITADGNMVVEGRVKDVVIRGGDKVSATELEGHLINHPKVGQAAVVALPDPVLGEAVCACVIADGAPPRLIELKKMLMARGVADYKLPDRLETYEAFPLTGLGKVDKKQLTADVLRRAAADA
ncbi:(2,3-dihydroxybenzoyl)adenylate synthase [Streptomyces chrestomyceticus]|uniref:(2,3-dihydroxybenzoyl)adenylate synthase n=1 Tax=Streptomyces chrestomyceticus TaxID=68185 RepID=UPI0037A4E8F9